MALNGTPASRQASTKAATASTEGNASAVTPPQRIFAPAPACRTAATAPASPRPGESSQNAGTPSLASTSACVSGIQAGSILPSSSLTS